MQYTIKLETSLRKRAFNMLTLKLNYLDQTEKKIRKGGVW
jgi:hypothetical protein